MRPENLEEWRGSGKARGCNEHLYREETLNMFPYPCSIEFGHPRQSQRGFAEKNVFFFLPLHVLNVGSLPESFFYPPSCCSIGVGPGGGRSI